MTPEEIGIDEVGDTGMYFITTTKNDIVINGSIISKEHLNFVKKEALKAEREETDKKIEWLKKELRPLCMSDKSHRDVCIVIAKAFKGNR